jgi:hypothetical protein
MSNLWWVVADGVIFCILLVSEPPQLWFWLVLFMVILAYGIERSWHQ